MRCFLVTLACVSGLACTPLPAETVRTIEPGSNTLGTKLAASGDSALIASGSDEPTTMPQGDRDFVYARAPRADRQAQPAQLPLHIQEDWWGYRAPHLGITTAMAKERDASISHSRAPADFWDEQTAVEAASVWTVLCNECHGGRRSVKDALEMPKPPAQWSEAEGLFFGNRRTYHQMFQVVHDGGPMKDRKRPEMPAWKGVFSKEIIWALLYFLEYQSGGIESRFPPSLYPRRPTMLRESGEN